MNFNLQEVSSSSTVPHYLNNSHISECSLNSLTSGDSGFDSLFSSENIITEQFQNIQEELDHAAKFCAESTMPKENVGLQHQIVRKRRRKNSSFSKMVDEGIYQISELLNENQEFLNNKNEDFLNKQNNSQEFMEKLNLDTERSQDSIISTIQLKGHRTSSFWSKIKRFLMYFNPRRNIRHGIAYGQDVLLPPLSQFSQIESCSSLTIIQCSGRTETAARIVCIVSKLEISRKIVNVDICYGLLSLMMEDNEEKSASVLNNINAMKSDIKKFANYLRKPNQICYN